MRTRWVVVWSVVATLLACAAGTFAWVDLAKVHIHMDGPPSTLVAHDEAACTALQGQHGKPFTKAELSRAIRLGESDRHAQFSYWTYSWASTLSDEKYVKAGSTQAQAFVLQVQNDLAHLNGICAGWGFRSTR